MITRSALALLLLVGCGGAETPATTGPSSAEARETSASGQVIQLHRDHRAGETFEVILRGRSETTTVLTPEGQEARTQEEQLEVRLVASVVIREVNTRGKPTLSEYTVRECTTGGESPVELLPAGAVVIVTAVDGPDDGTITLRGGELTEDQRERIDLVVTTRLSQMDDDDVFGSAEPREVGETWPVDADIAARDLSKIPSLRMAAENVRGNTTLSAMEVVDGVECQHVEAALSARDFELLNLPEGSTMQSSSLEVRMAAALPIDASLHRVRSATSMEMQVVVQLPPNAEGRRALMAVRTRQMTTAEIRP